MVTPCDTRHWAQRGDTHGGGGDPGDGCSPQRWGSGEPGRGRPGALSACRDVRVATCGGVRRRGALGPVRSGFCRQPRAAAAAAAAPCRAERGLRTPRASGDVEVGVRRRRGTEPASAPRPRPRPRAGADLPFPPRSLSLLSLRGSRAAPAAPGSAARSAAAPGPRLSAGPRGAPPAELGWGVSGGCRRKGRWRRRKSLAGGSAARPAARRRARAARGGGGAGAGRLPACPPRARPVLPARRPSGPAASRGWEGTGGDGGVTSKVFLGATEPRCRYPQPGGDALGAAGRDGVSPPWLPPPPRTAAAAPGGFPGDNGGGGAGGRRGRRRRGEAMGSGVGGATRGGDGVGGTGGALPGPRVRPGVSPSCPRCSGLPPLFGSAAGARARGGRGSGAARHRPAMCDNSPNFIVPPGSQRAPPAPFRRQTGFPNPLLPPAAAGTVPSAPRHPPSRHGRAVERPSLAPAWVPPAPKPPWGLWIVPEFGNYSLKLRRTAAPCAPRRCGVFVIFFFPFYFNFIIPVFFLSTASRSRQRPSCGAGAASGRVILCWDD